MKKLYLLAIIGVFGVLLSMPNFGIVRADTETPQGGNTQEIDALNKKIKEKQDKIKEIEKSIANYQTQIKTERTKAQSLANQLSLLDNHIAQVELDIEATQTKVDSLQLELDRLNLEIQDKETSIAKQQTMVAELLRSLHYEEGKEYIEIAASYDTFSDFYNQVQYVKTVEEDLGLSVKSLHISRDELQQKQEETTSRQEAYKTLSDELLQKKKDLEEQVSYKGELLAETQSSELKYKTLVDRLKQQYAATEQEISGIEKEVRKKLEAEKKTESLSDDAMGALSWPTQSRHITAYFYDKTYPFRNIFEHNAVDIRAAHGTPVKAAASGYVGRAKTCTTASCYAYVMIIHADGMSTVYGHLSALSVKGDQFVARGDIIGYSGATPGTVGAGPFTTGPHLHFEVRKNGIPVNPLEYLVKDY